MIRSHMARYRTLLLAFHALLGASLCAQPGTLDATFGTGGIQVIELGLNGDGGYDLIAQADGKLLACGYSRQGATDAAFVSRRLPDGSLDGTFGTIFLPSGSVGKAYGIDLASDGSIYVCGYVHTTSGYDEFALWHVLTDGTLDALFGTGGLVTTQIGFASARAQDLVVQPDGKILLVGYESLLSDRDGVFVRYNADGSLDNSFSGDGIWVMATYDSQDQLHAVDLLEDGSIIAGGYVDLVGDDKAMVVKLNSSGTQVSGFGGDGVVVPSLPWTEYRVNGLAAEGQSILIVGYSADVSTSSDVFIAKLNDIGVLDAGFGTGGYTGVNVSDDDFFEDVKVGSDGKPVACGYAGSTAPGGDLDFLLTRFTATGQPDVTFGTNGIVTTEVSTSGDGAFGLTIQPDGDIVSVGYFGLINTEAVLVRYANDLSTAAAEAVAGAPGSLFPNPASGQVWLTLSSSGLTFLDVFDAAGSLVFTDRIGISGVHPVDVSGWREGNYVIRTVHGDQVLHQRVAILH